jgi:hypothetical protein
MLNELLTVERGAVKADITLSLRHPEIKSAAKKKKTLSVFLDADGHVAKVRAVPTSRLEEKPLWKLSEGNKNSFPFVQPKKPLWDDATIELWKQGLSRKPSVFEEREKLLEIVSKSHARSDDFGEWASEGMIKALRMRRQDLIALEQSDVAAFPITIDRFLLATDKKVGGDPIRLVLEITNKLIEEFKTSADSDLHKTTIALLIESAAKGGALYFDAKGDFSLSLIDYRIEEPLCKHLRQVDLERAERRGETGICGITGDVGSLVVGNFSEPNLPYVGQSFLFSRNKDNLSASRYGESSAASIDP